MMMSCKTLKCWGLRVSLLVAAGGLLGGCPPPVEPPVAPLALFSATPLTGIAPLEVAFTDESLPGTEPLTFLRWDFGDGTTSTEAAPVHTYTEPGTYTVTLTLASVSGVNTRTRTDYVRVRGETGPRADFRADKRAGDGPLTVKFSDESNAGSSEIISRLWDFGDGNTSTEDAPTHTYEKNGNFTVSLTVETAIGEDTETKGAFITVRGKNVSLGGPAADRAFALALTGDGRFVLAGDTESPEDGSRDIYLVITDKFGNLATERRFGSADDETAAGLAPAGDGGHFIVGTAVLETGGSDAILVRTDAAGNRLWSASYGGPGDERAAAITASADGGAVIVGSTAEDEIAGTVAWAVRVDAEGRVRWVKTFGAGTFTGIIARGTGFAACGNSVDGQEARVTRLDAAGNILWDVAVGGAGAQEAHAIEALDSNGFAIAGTTAEEDGPADAWAAVIDESGGVVWSAAAGGAQADRASAVVAREDGGIVIAGATRRTAASLDDAYLAAFDAGGGLDWEKAFGGTQADRANALVVEESGGYAVAGSTESFGAAGTNLYLFRVGADGTQGVFPATNAR